MTLAAVGLLTLMAVPLQDDPLPFGSLPVEESAALSKMAPDECLFFLQWSSGGPAQASGTTPTDRLMADPEIQTLLRSLVQLANNSIDSMDLADNAAERFFVEKLNRVIPQLMANSGAIILESLPSDREGWATMRGAIVLELGDSDKDVLELLGRVGDDFLGPISTAEGWGNGILYTIDSREMGGPVANIGVRDGFLIMSSGRDVPQDYFAKMEGEAPKWLVDVKESMGIDERSYVGHLNVKQIWESLLDEMPAEGQSIGKAIGFDRISSIDVVGGIRNDEFVSKSRIKSSGPYPAALMPFAGASVQLADLDSIPASAELALVANVDIQEYLTQVIKSLDEIDADLSQEMLSTLNGEGLGDDDFAINQVLDALGDTMIVYHASEEGGNVMGFSATIEVADADSLRAEDEKLVQLLAELWPEDEEFDPFAFGPGPSGGAWKVMEKEFEGETIRYVVSRSVWNFSPFAFSWCITDDQLILAPYPQNIRAILSRTSDFESLASSRRVADAFEGNGDVGAVLMMDTAELYSQYSAYLQIGLAALRQEMRYSGVELPNLDFPSGVAMTTHMQPDVSIVRLSEDSIELESHLTIPGTDAVLLGSASAFLAVLLDEAGVDALTLLSPSRAREAESILNLKQIALAMHNYHDVFRGLPAASPTDEDGRELLSWRVHILPFIEQQALYDRFRLDEPWDSEHNIQLLEFMPPIYRTPGSGVEANMTNYVTIRDENSLFPGDRKIRFADVVDGLSNTIMVVEASDDAAVLWTKPDDVTLDPMKPMRLLKGPGRKGFHAALGDGSVAFFPEWLGVDELNKWFSRNDGEIIEFDPHNPRRFERMEARDYEAVPDR